MFFIVYAFKGQVHMFAVQVKIVSHSSCRTSVILKYFCPLKLMGVMHRTPCKQIFCPFIDSLSTPVIGPGQNIFLSESCHVAYQIKGKVV